MTESEWWSAIDPHRLVVWLLNSKPDFNDDQFDVLVSCRILHRVELGGTTHYILSVATVTGDELLAGAGRAQVRLVHDTFGPLPFRDIAVPPSWLTSDVLALARGIYDEKAFDRMPILADALQDAGCDSDDILSHCRAEGWEHVRGCWAIDLLFGRPWREPL